MLANGLVAGVEYVQELESEKRGEKAEVVLVGHSSGGGLSQLILGEGDVKAKALVLVGAISELIIDKYWSARVYFN